MQWTDDRLSAIAQSIERPLDVGWITNLFLFDLINTERTNMPIPRGEIWARLKALAVEKGLRDEDVA
jgi:hypothetical protein